MKIQAPKVYYMFPIKVLDAPSVLMLLDTCVCVIVFEFQFLPFNAIFPPVPWLLYFYVNMGHLQFYFSYTASHAPNEIKNYGAL